MTQQFRVPCNHCDASEVVELRHAGSRIPCSVCQGLIDVPKLRELKQLEPVQSAASDAAKRGWGPLAGGLFSCGLLLLAISVGSGIYLHGIKNSYRQFTEKPNIEDLSFASDITKASLTDSWRVWEQLLERKDFVERPTPTFVRARERVKELDGWSKVFYGAATVGLLMMISCIFVRPAAESS